MTAKPEEYVDSVQSVCWCMGEDGCLKLHRTVVIEVLEADDGEVLLRINGGKELPARVGDTIRTVIAWHIGIPYAEPGV